MNETTALATTNGEVLPATQPTMIRPLASPDEALENWEAFQALKGKLLGADDIQSIQGRTFIKKSGWRKIAAAFGISTEAVAEEREDLPSGAFLWRVRVRATAHNGRYAEGTAGCASNERRFSHVEHDVYAQAFTRACNRAISDLVGGGEVSAEEMKAEHVEAPITRAQAESVTAKFLAAMQEQGDFDPLPLTAHVIEACVIARGELRRAYKVLQTQYPQYNARGAVEAGEEDPADDD